MTWQTASPRHKQEWAVLSVLGVVTAVLAWVAVDRFRMNSNLSDLILQDAPWRVDFDRYEAEFPDLVRTAVIVVSGKEFKQVEDTTRAFEAALKSRPETTITAIHLLMSSTTSSMSSKRSDG